jgi:hypothetical protein
MTKTLRFWVDAEAERVDAEAEDTGGQNVACSKAQRIAEILHRYERAGEATRYLRADGRTGWKATSQMITRLADAEREVEDDFADSD